MLAGKVSDLLWKILRAFWKFLGSSKDSQQKLCGSVRFCEFFWPFRKFFASSGSCGYFTDFPAKFYISLHDLSKPFTEVSSEVLETSR